MRIVYNPKTDTIAIAESSWFRKYTYREISILGFQKLTGSMFFTRGRYLSNDFIEICYFD